MNDEKLEQLKSNLTKMKAYMDDLTPRNPTLASNAGWRWVHDSVGKSLTLFEPDMVDANEEGLFPDETTPDSKSEIDPLKVPDSETKPDSEEPDKEVDDEEPKDEETEEED